MIFLLRRFIVFITLLPLTAAALESDWHFENVGRVVSISDIHGAYDAMVSTLQSAGVIDAELNWSAAGTHLVIVGDILDRGPNSRPAMDLLMQLEEQAIQAGGRVHVLIGNHEAMNLTGDLRYVAAAEYAAFADDETPEERAHWKQVYAELAASAGTELTDEQFAHDYPAGFFAHRLAFRSDGKYGKWLLSKPVMVVINGVAYVHGGVSPLMSQYSLEDVNRGMMQSLAQYVQHVATLIDAGVLAHADNANAHVDVLDKYLPSPSESPQVLKAIAEIKRLRDSPLFSMDGPLWYRGNVSCGRIIEEQRLDESLRAIGAERVVIGHTPTAGRQVLERFGGKIIEVDTGMLNSYYKGRGNALVMEGDDFSVITQNGTVLDDPLQHPRRVGFRKRRTSVEELETLLSNGEVTAVSSAIPGPNMRYVVEVSNGKQSVEAIFLKRIKRGFYPDLAAYRLDRILGLDMVPVTVQREVDGSDGSLQFLPARTIDESSRSKTRQGGSAWCPMDDQWQAMYLFDALIHNSGRSPRRMLYSQDRWQLILIEQRRAFPPRKGIPDYLRSVPLHLTPGWRKELEALDEATVAEHFEDVLDKGQRKALLMRRKDLLRNARRSGSSKR